MEHKIDSRQTLVKLKTYEEYSNRVVEAGEFLVIQSEEITGKYEDKHIEDILYEMTWTQPVVRTE